MTTETIQIKNTKNDSREVTIDLEFEHYLFEVYLNDRIEDEIKRMIDFSKLLVELSPNDDSHEL
jgi:hypothetical protein